MPCGDGMISGRNRKLVDRGGCALSKIHLDQNNKKLCSKECQGPISILTGSDQRFIILTFLTLELDTWKVLAPFSILVQGSDLKNCLKSEVRERKDDHDPLSPPLSIIFPVSSPKEQKMDSSEHPGSVKSCNSSGANIPGQSCNRNKRTNSARNSSNSLGHSSIESNKFTESSGVGSDFLVSHSEVDRPVKKSTRRKRKKKGKKYKKSMQKISPPGIETPCTEIRSGDSVGGTSTSSDIIATDEFYSQSNMSEEVTQRTFSANNIAGEKHENKTNNNVCVNCSAEPLACTYFGNDLCEAIASSADMSSCDDVSLSNLGIDGAFINLAVEASSSQPPELVTISSYENATSAYSSDFSCSMSSDEYSTTLVDKFIDTWKTELRENCSSSVDTHASNKDDDKQSLSEVSVLHTRDDASSCSTTKDSCDMNSEMSRDCYIYWSKDIVDTDNSTESAHSSSQASNSGDFQPVIYRRRGRLNKRLSQGLNGTHAFGTLHDQTGKDNNCSVLRRYQNCKIEERVRMPKKSATLLASGVKDSDIKKRSDTFIQLKQNGRGNLHAYTSLERASPITQSKTSNHANEGKVQFKDIDGIYNAPEKLRKKPSSVSKQGDYCPIKISHTEKLATCRPSQNHIERRELETSLQETHQQCTSTQSSSSSNDSYHEMAMPSDRVDSCQSESHQEKQFNLEDTLSGNVSMICEISLDVSENRKSSSLMGSCSLNQEHIEVQFERRKKISNNSVDEVFRSVESETESSCADLNDLDGATNSVRHKWAPAGEKDSVMSSMKQKDNLAQAVNDQVLIRSDPDEEIETSDSNFDCCPQVSGGHTCLSPCFQGETSPSTEADIQAICHSHLYEDEGAVLAKSNSCLAHEVKSKYLSDFKLHSDKIVQAVHNSYKLQVASDGVHMVTGSPIAGIERFLKLASPFLDKICCNRDCRMCPMDQLIGQALCQHQIPNIPLGCVWQWYERPGNYGMEVKFEDCYVSKMSHNDRYGFSAYFVPYLSAVQLFGWSRSCEVAVEDKIHNKSFTGTMPSDGELLFEYFESDLPHLRRPLFDKIKQLVGGGTLSDGKTYGNPMKLENANLRDLHPCSWFAVAWYPIYQIPHGNFCTAFLTYHSLGHFVHTNNIPHGIGNIISPVVGLQSYKAKEEFWFRPKVHQREAALSPDPSDILKERMMTLEQTASVMAKASVRKDGVRSEIRQRDYNFFSAAARRVYTGPRVPSTH